MKKHHIKHAGFFLAAATLVFNIVLTSVMSLSPTQAKAGPYSVVLSASPTTALADGVTKIKLTAVGAKKYYCDVGMSQYTVSSVADCDATGGTINTSSYPEIPLEVVVPADVTPTATTLSTANADSTAVFYVSSNVAGTKTITVQHQSAGIYYPVSTNITFTAPPTATTATPTATKKTTATQPATPTEQPEKPVVKTDTVTLNGQQISQETTENEKPSVNESEEIVLSGTTEPNAKVRLYIFSEPQMVETTADANGKWTYTLSGLPVGDHHVEAAIVDESGNEGDRTVLGAFTIIASSLPIDTVAQTPQTNVSPNRMRIIYIIMGVSLLAIAYIVWYWLHHKKSILSHHHSSDPNSSVPLEK